MPTAYLIDSAGKTGINRAQNVKPPGGYGIKAIWDKKTNARELLRDGEVEGWAPSTRMFH